MKQKSQREKCGCHKGCSTRPHKCDKPCKWPYCLTPEEGQELAEKIKKDLW